MSPPATSCSPNGSYQVLSTLKAVKLQGVASWVHLSRFKVVPTDKSQEPEGPPSGHPYESTPSSRSPQDSEDPGQPENPRWMSEPPEDLKAAIQKGQKSS